MITPAEALTVGWLPAPARYPVYIESDAYASNLKTKLSCGSVLLVLEMEVSTAGPSILSSA